MDGPFVFEAIASVATVGALVAAIWQLHVGNRDRREAEASLRANRAMRLFEEVVAGGDTARAFHELSVYLRHLGSDGGSIVTWHTPTDADLSEGGVFAPTARDREAAFANLYTVLWFFERAEVAIKTNVVDRDATFQTLGFHLWWWAQILRDLAAPKSKAALARLGVWAEAEAEQVGLLADWTSRCTTDFSGGPPRRLAADAPAREVMG